MRPLAFKIPKSGVDRIHWQEDYSEKFYPRLHMHPEIQITHILSGRGKFICGSYVGNFAEGDLYIIGANIPHIFRSDETTHLSHAHTIFVEEDFLLKSLFSQGDEIIGKRFLSESVCGLKITEKQNQIERQISDLQGVTGINLLINFSKLVGLLAYERPYKLLMTTNLEREWSDSDNERLEKVFGWMMAQFHERIDLNQAAELSSLSKSAFCRYFRQRTGKSFVELLNEIRIQHASRLLTETKDSIQSIGFRSGFNNLSLFNRKFLEIQGSTPSAFRKAFQD